MSFPRRPPYILRKLSNKRSKSLDWIDQTEHHSDEIFGLVSQCEGKLYRDAFIVYITLVHIGA